MNAGFYSAKSGLLSMQQGLDIVSNNISNMETNGYKVLRPSFSDLIYSIQNPQFENSQTGHGVKQTKTDLMYERGPLVMTNRDLDFATPTDSFFAVTDESGKISYTKDGAFHMSNNGGTWNLVTAEGKIVLDYNNKPVTASIGSDGKIDGEALIKNIGVFSFDNPYGLLAKGSNTYAQTESSGEAKADMTADKLSGALETSTVDFANQMVKIIEYQRAFQLNSKMVQTSDEIQSIVNNLR